MQTEALWKTVAVKFSYETSLPVVLVHEYMYLVFIIQQVERSVYKDQLNQEKFFWRMELQEKRKKIEASLEIAKGDCFKQHLEMILFNMFVCVASSDIV